MRLNPFKIFAKKPHAPDLIDAEGYVKVSGNELIPVLQAYGLYPTGSGLGVGADWAGDKFAGGFGNTYIYRVDYATLRARSDMLFTENLYARGLVRRLVTTEVNTGLSLEAAPEMSIIGMDEQQQFEWGENVEILWNLWAKDKTLVDYYAKSTLAEIERMIRREALIKGDVLVVLRYQGALRLPKIQLIDADHVVTPLDQLDRLPEGSTIENGVEVDSQGRQVAYWVKQKGGLDAEVKRVPAYGSRTGRRLAWLVYGTEQRIGDTRGVPMLALILQSIRELDRYRDSTQRKATINALLAMFIARDSDEAPTAPMTGGATKRSRVVSSDDSTGAQGVPLLESQNGLVLQRLAKGEKPYFHSANGQGDEFGKFEDAIVHAMAWAHEMPPTILKLAFSANFAASQAEINQLKMYLEVARGAAASNVNQPVYSEWLSSSILGGFIPARGYVDALYDRANPFKRLAWEHADWAGAIYFAADIVKQQKAYDGMVKSNFVTYSRATRETSGMKFSKVMHLRKRENEMIAAAERPMREFIQEFNAPASSDNASAALLDSFTDAVEQIIQEG